MSRRRRCSTVGRDLRVLPPGAVGICVEIVAGLYRLVHQRDRCPTRCPAAAPVAVWLPAWCCRPRARARRRGSEHAARFIERTLSERAALPTPAAPASSSGRAFRPTDDRQGMSAPRLDSKIATDSDEFRARAAHNRALAEKLARRRRSGGAGRHREKPRAPCRARQIAAPRPRRAAARSGLAVPRDRPARRLRHVRRRGARRGDDRRHRPRVRAAR